MYEQIAELISNISYCTTKSANIIKEIAGISDNDIVSHKLDTLNNLYFERNDLVEQFVKLVKDNNEGILNSIPEWKHYLNNIAPIEEQNIAFLHQKTTDTKSKLFELANNKSLMIYNKKVELSYENKFL